MTKSKKTLRLWGLSAVAFAVCSLVVLIGCIFLYLYLFDLKIGSKDFLQEVTAPLAFIAGVGISFSGAYVAIRLADQSNVLAQQTFKLEFSIRLDDLIAHNAMNTEKLSEALLDAIEVKRNIDKYILREMLKRIKKMSAKTSNSRPLEKWHIDSVLISTIISDLNENFKEGGEFNVLCSSLSSKLKKLTQQLIKFQGGVVCNDAIFRSFLFKRVRTRLLELGIKADAEAISDVGVSENALKKLKLIKDPVITDLVAIISGLGNSAFADLIRILKELPDEFGMNTRALVQSFLLARSGIQFFKPSDLTVVPSHWTDAYDEDHDYIGLEGYAWCRRPLGIMVYEFYSEVIPANSCADLISLGASISFQHSKYFESFSSPKEGVTWSFAYDGFMWRESSDDQLDYPVESEYVYVSTRTLDLVSPRILMIATAIPGSGVFRSLRDLTRTHIFKLIEIADESHDLFEEASEFLKVKTLGTKNNRLINQFLQIDDQELFEDLHANYRMSHVGSGFIPVFQESNSELCPDGEGAIGEYIDFINDGKKGLEEFIHAGLGVPHPIRKNSGILRRFKTGKRSCFYSLNNVYDWGNEAGHDYHGPLFEGDIQHFSC